MRAAAETGRSVSKRDPRGLRWAEVKGGRLINNSYPIPPIIKDEAWGLGPATVFKRASI